MDADLQHLIRLQTLDAELQDLQRTIDTEDDRYRAIDTTVDSFKAALAAERERLDVSQRDRREIEKDLAQVQGRLARYRDQLMAVKTNKEYQAMQTEIATAEGEVRELEDKVLERLVEADEVSAAVKTAEAALARAEAEARAARTAAANDTVKARERLVSAATARSDVAASISASALSLYEHIASRRGTALVEARDGHCTTCHVRLRPKVYQDVRRNDTIIQCDSCQRILYYAPRPNHAAPPAGS